MSHNLRESLSALMDNEATELELRRVLRQAKDDPDLLDEWQRYHLVRDVMHQQAGAPAPHSLLAGIREAISEAPLSQDEVTGDARDSGEAGRVPRVLVGFSRALGQGAIAASVALVVLFTAHTLNQSPGQVAAPTALAGGSASAGDAPESEGSAELTALTANNSFVETPFNRNVSFQGDDESRLDPQSRDRLRRAIHRAFEQNTQTPKAPVLYIEHLPE